MGNESKLCEQNNRRWQSSDTHLDVSNEVSFGTEVLLFAMESSPIFFEESNDLRPSSVRHHPSSASLTSEMCRRS